MNIDHNQIQIRRVWSLVESIENRLNKMADEIPILKEKLEAYQNGELKRLYFINFLTKFLDNLDNDNKE